MTNVEKFVEIDCPVRTVYNQYTQFEDWPRFMEGVEKIHQTSDSTLHWVTSIGGVKREFDTRITEQIPDDRIAWVSTSNEKHAGVATFHRLSDNKTRVMVQLSYDPEGFTENVGSALGLVGNRLEGDLERLKEFIEKRGQETGAWRGEIKQPGSR